jgi:hypothetical protein
MRRIRPRFAESHFSSWGWFFSARLVQLNSCQARHAKNESDNYEGKVTLHGPLSEGFTLDGDREFFQSFIAPALLTAAHELQLAGTDPRLGGGHPQ